MTDVVNRTELEAELARLYSKLSASHRKDLLRLLGDPPSYANVPASFWGQVAKDLDGSFMPFLAEVYMQQAENLLAGLPVGVDWAIINQQAVSWARAHTYDLITGLTDHSQAVVREAIGSFFEQAMTRADLEKLIGRAFGPVRAEMIAVTEVTRAATAAEIQIGEELAKDGILMTAIWLTRNDEIVAKCPVCYPLNERPADGYTRIRTPYWNSPTTGSQITPPAHPRCRCSMGWELPK